MIRNVLIALVLAALPLRAERVRVVVALEEGTGTVATLASEAVSAVTAARTGTSAKD